MSGKHLTGLPYFGGKSGNSHTLKGRWVASLLPQETRVLYCEPFAGMLGILLQRPRAKVEIVNDLNERVINWWRCVRDYPEEFGNLLEYTPYSRVDFDWARDNLDDGDMLTRGLAFHIVCSQSAMHTDHKQHWALHYDESSGRLKMWGRADVMALSKRLRYVQLEAKDALDILDKTMQYEKAVIYCDPPYTGYSDVKHYRANINLGELSAKLSEQKGRVAVSCYGDAFDHLGWERHEFDTFVYSAGGRDRSPRTEVLWTNYTPLLQPQLW